MILLTLIKTSGGHIKGYTKGNLNYFLGIPYAHQPINEQRFKRSKCLNKWDKTIDATSFQSIPPQPYNKLETFFSTHSQSFNQSEDCLYLNIWSQNNEHINKPVIIYFYGGGFVNGHGSQELYTPEYIVEQHDVIVITFNYRLGALGFLDWSYFNKNNDKNNGLSDQINVLKWVHTFITYFGGNPNNITLMGQSAGSMSIMALMQQPELDQYYHQVMLLSGSLRLDSQLLGQEKAAHFESLIHTYYPDKHITDLTATDILTLMSYDEASRGQSKGLELIYAPIKDSNMSRPLSQFTKPLVIGTTKDEGNIYIRNESRKLSPERFIEVMKLNDINLNISQVQTGEEQARMVTLHYFEAPVCSLLNTLKHHRYCWKLRFDWCLPNQSPFQSAYHILDLVFWFGKVNILKTHGIQSLEHERRLSTFMIRDLVYFATHHAMPWPTYSINTPYCHIYK